LFFKKRFGFDAVNVPVLDKDIKRTKNLDKEVRASGFTKEMESEFEEVRGKIEKFDRKA